VIYRKTALLISVNDRTWSSFQIVETSSASMVGQCDSVNVWRYVQTKHDKMDGKTLHCTLLHGKIKE